MGVGYSELIIKADAKALEWRSYVELSQDPVGMQEIINNEDVLDSFLKSFYLGGSIEEVLGLMLMITTSSQLLLFLLTGKM